MPTSRVRIDKRQWNRTLTPVLDGLREDLGLPAGSRLTAELHSLLVYSPGQFFLPHQDSEKSNDMVGTLTVTLPGTSHGGELIVRHGEKQVVHRSSDKLLSFVAFYADCLHEVQPVTSGYRVVLTYNLLLSAAEAAANCRADSLVLQFLMLKNHRLGSRRAVRETVPAWQRALMDADVLCREKPLKTKARLWELRSPSTGRAAGPAGGHSAAVAGAATKSRSSQVEWLGRVSCGHRKAKCPLSTGGESTCQTIGSVTRFANRCV